MSVLRTSFKIGGASGASLDQAGRRWPKRGCEPKASVSRLRSVKLVLVARASRHVAIQRRVSGAHPGVPVFLKAVLRSTLAGLVSLCALAGALALPSVAAAEECPNAAFRVGPSSHLPDCRAYELVSPPFKNGGLLVIPTAGAGKNLPGINPSGSSLLIHEQSETIPGAEAFPGISPGGPISYFTTQRTASGWVSTPVEPPASEYMPYAENGLSTYGGSDAGEGPGGQVTVWPGRGVWEADNRIDFFAREPDRSIVDIGPALPPTAPPGDPLSLGAKVSLMSLGLSAGASRLFFNIRNDFWPGDGTEERPGTNYGVFPSLYEYLGAGNTTPLLVGVDGSGGQISQCGVVLGGGEESESAANSYSFNENVHNAVSADGNTVFFTAFPPEDGCKGSGPPVRELFARIDNGLPGARTVAISEPSKEDCRLCDTEPGVLAGAQFAGASEDGSKVFFTTAQPLLDGATGPNVYEYDFDAPAGERVVRVSAGDSSVSNPTVGLVLNAQLGEGEPRCSEDGSHVYFIATGVLTTAPNGEGEAAEAGANNLYVFERDAAFPGGHLAFVAKLSARDIFGLTAEEKWRPDITPDGRFLVFVSERDLTPDDTSVGARQVFEYDAQTGALVRVSIGLDGFNHNGNVVGGRELDASIVFTAGSPDQAASAAAYWSGLSVSADGAYVFFQSPVGLTPQASDHANNVYEYHAGRVSLISDGQDLTEIGGVSVVQLLGTDASGGDVFFSTVDRLVGQDSDSNLDIYDARVDGGFPAPAAAGSCSGESCQGVLSGAPVLLSPGSEFQAGSGPPVTPLAGGPAAKPKPKPKPKAKVKRQRVKKRSWRRAGKGRGRKAGAAGARASRRGDRS
jgi:hypothetical protein